MKLKSILSLLDLEFSPILCPEKDELPPQNTICIFIVTSRDCKRVRKQSHMRRIKYWDDLLGLSQIPNRNKYQTDACGWVESRLSHRKFMICDLSRTVYREETIQLYILFQANLLECKKESSRVTGERLLFFDVFFSSCFCLESDILTSSNVVE